MVIPFTEDTKKFFLKGGRPFSTEDLYVMKTAGDCMGIYRWRQAAMLATVENGCSRES
jgi:hypothetical protein